jgi:hypothetical protein
MEGTMSSLKRWTYRWLTLAVALLSLVGQVGGEDGTATPLGRMSTSPGKTQGSI